MPFGTATIIYLVSRLLGQSSDLPESRNGPDRSCSHIWPCSRWGLPSQPVTRLLVGSYIKGPKSPHLFTLTLGGCQGWHPPRAVSFLLHFPCPSSSPFRAATSDGGYYPPPRPVEPGLSSPRS